MKYVDLVEKTLNEKSDPTLEKIADIIKANPNKGLMGLRPDLEKIFKKKDIDFTMMGGAHFRKNF